MRELLLLRLLHVDTTCGHDDATDRQADRQTDGKTDAAGKISGKLRERTSKFYSTRTEQQKRREQGHGRQKDK